MELLVEKSLRGSGYALVAPFGLAIRLSISCGEVRYTLLSSCCRTPARAETEERTLVCPRCQAPLLHASAVELAAGASGLEGVAPQWLAPYFPPFEAVLALSAWLVAVEAKTEECLEELWRAEYKLQKQKSKLSAQVSAYTALLE